MGNDARYRTAIPLAHGGTADVFRTFDEQLGRPVALKFLRRDDPALVERLMREARAQARLDHPNICRVYDVGRRDGAPYIAMQLIEGLTLGEAAATMTLEEKVRVLCAVADAVQAAHRAGLVHRDLKPGNVMVERDEEGRAVPYVLDFGLVHDVEAVSVTHTGAVMGTPSYMAPEQARGDLAAVDRRTDVYGLGATLYTVLTGVPPFDGESATMVLLKVLQDDPVPPRRRDPNLPQDLESITLRCLEKDPQRRYPSARALEEDLQRWLDGKPVTARPATLGYRLARGARRNRPLVLVGAVGLAVALGLGGWAVAERLAAARRAGLAQELGQAVKDAEWQLRVAQMSPVHDLAPERRQIETLLADIEHTMAELGDDAQAAGAYALGRGRLALDDWERALPHLERAWELGLRSPELAYARGVALGRAYSRDAARARALRDEARRERELAAARTRYRDPAIAALQSARVTPSAPLAYVEALIAFYEERWDDALSHGARALIAAPWLWEAEELRGDVNRLRANGFFLTNDLTTGYATLDAADAAFTAVERIAPSAPNGYLGHCANGLFRLHRTNLEAVDDAGFAALRDRVAAACETVRRVDPNHADLPRHLSNLHLTSARRQLTKGNFAAEELAAALSAAEEAVRRKPGSAGAHRAHADALLEYGDALDQRDPKAARDYLTRAGDAFEKSLVIDPWNPAAANNAGVAWRLRAVLDAEAGVDPMPALARAEKSYQQAAELFPKEPSVRNNIARVMRTRASWQAEHGVDPRPQLIAADAILEAQIAAVPDRPDLHENRAGLSLEAARAERRWGGNPAPWIVRGLTEAVRARELGPERINAVEHDAGLWLERLREPGATADTWLEAQRHVEEVIARRPDHANGFALRAAFATLRAGTEHGRARAASARAALADLERAAGLPGAGPALAVSEIEVCLLWLDDGGPDSLLTRAGSTAERALATAPHRADVLAAAARVEIRRATRDSDAAGRETALAAARDLAGRAVAVDAKLEGELATELAALPGHEPAAPAPATAAQRRAA